jgi:hypothetical protein
LAALPELGIDLSAVTDQLEIDGVNAFIHSFETLLAVIEAKSRTLLARTSTTIIRKRDP